MANKKVSELTAYTTPVSGDVLPINDTANTTTKKITVDNLFKMLSSLFRIKDSSDTTKQLAVDISGFTTATTRTLVIPNADTTMVATDVTQTISNKTLGTGTKVAIGSDADKDMYYRASDGTLTRIPVGTDNQILKLNGTTPNWEAETVTVDATTSVKGIVELATASEISAGTATGGTGAPLVVTPDALASSTPAFSGLSVTNTTRLTRLAGYTPAGNTTENTVYTTTISANLLSTNGLIRVRTPIAISTNGTTDTYTLRLKFGGVTLQTQTITTVAVGGGTNSSMQGILEGLIINNASTGAQNHGMMFAGGFSLPNGPNPASITYGNSADSTSSVDTTSNQTLTLTVQRSNGGGGSVVFSQTLVETIKNA